MIYHIPLEVRLFARDRLLQPGAGRGGGGWGGCKPTWIPKKNNKHVSCLGATKVVPCQSAGLGFIVQLGQSSVSLNSTKSTTNSTCSPNPNSNSTQLSNSSPINSSGSNFPRCVFWGRGSATPYSKYPLFFQGIFGKTDRSSMVTASFFSRGWT